ncbi:MAG: 2-dehydro-3-deoxyphosphogluconate aldolase [Anaerolinea sp.]|nr:2-dehydro-3-deoxyphosphogluconate aldolase [Anaerolinea sp.]
MNTIETLGQIGIVPVVILDEIKYAIHTASAMRKGGVDVMEIALRTKAGLDSIKAVSKDCADVLLGAGTVLNLEQCKACVDAGAQFIVSPGFNRELVSWCVKNNVAIIPGCVTPTEIMKALDLGVEVIKFFPANVFGGLSAMKALAAPFGSVKFIPTGGVNALNLSEFAAASFVHAVGGSWVCDKSDIAASNFEKITSLCVEAVQIIHGFEVVHLGINAPNDEVSINTMRELDMAFGFIRKPDSSSNYSGTAMENAESLYHGKNGYIAVKTNSISRAIYYLAKKGFVVDMETAKFMNDKLINVYIKNEIGGFTVHLLQK